VGVLSGKFNGGNRAWQRFSTSGIKPEARQRIEPNAGENGKMIPRSALPIVKIGPFFASRHCPTWWANMTEYP